LPRFDAFFTASAAVNAWTLQLDDAWSKDDA